MARYKYNGRVIEADDKCAALEIIFGSQIEQIDTSLNVSKKPKIIDIRGKLPFSRSNGKIPLTRIKHAVIHHDGSSRPLAYNSLSRYIGQANYHIKPQYNKYGRLTKGNWGHIAYNYIIDNVGDVFYCSTLGEIGYHAGNEAVNKSSIAIKLDGDLTKQKVTAKQWKSYQDLCVWLTTERPDIPLLVKSEWRRHGEVRAGGTLCPGNIDIMDF